MTITTEREQQRVEHLVLGRPRPVPELGPKPRGMSKAEWRVQKEQLRVRGRTLLSFVADLGWLRSQRWTLIRAARDVARAGGCESAIGRVDTGGDSLILANGASSAAMAASAANQPFSIGWTRADNTTVELDGAAMIALGLAIVAHVGACHAEGVARRAALDAAVDEAAIAAVPVEGGWPGE